MASVGPMVVVAAKPAAEAVALLGKAGAFPIVEAKWADAAAAIDEIKPCAVLLAEAEMPPDRDPLQALAERIDAAALVTPVLARLTREGALPLRNALAVSFDDPMRRMIARLNSALRIRTLHATVLRRSGSVALPRPPASGTQEPDGPADATVICAGRGGSYPALAVATGERVGLIGALSIETAGRYLKSRDVEGLVIGDGFGPRVVEGLLNVLAEDVRFRDLPIGVLAGSRADDDRLPNLIHGDGDPVRLIERLIPFVRLQAFESNLRRLLKSLETDGMLDPVTGLFAEAAFWSDLDHAVRQAEESGSCLSVARFAFEDIRDGRAHLDAARLFSRLVREIDFACQEEDGAILAAFTETDLRSAHVVARRIASVLRHTMLASGDHGMIRPTVTLATLKPEDNLSTLVARLGTYPKVAAG
jgi:hypothetical protein